ncbi:MAG: hypothetical protein PWR24_1809 [Desulfonauticus sp.]|nr:hypothetical protein [Desulfonauticus sp.]
MVRNKEKVCVVTVTYGDRFHFLKQVIDACFKEGVDKAIVVDNGSVLISKEKLKKYEKENKERLKVIYLNENSGSAYGYKVGLQDAYNCKECDFIWLLDDDNKPLENSLNILLNFWSSLEVDNKEEKIALLSYRFKKEQMAKESIINKLIVGKKNSFMGFHIKDLPKKILKHLKIRVNLITDKKEKTQATNVNVKYGVVPVAPYGGLFIHKNILNKIGYPNEEFFLYADDHDWTNRITKNSGKIYLLLDSKIDDLELSWHVPKSVKDTAFSIISRGNPQRVYYSVRNRVFFEINNLVDNKVIYWMNIFVYLLFISFSSTKNLKLIIKAIKDGYKGKLGKLEV